MVSHRISSSASVSDDGPLLIDFLNDAPDLKQRDLTSDVVSEFSLLLLGKKVSYFPRPDGPVWAQLTRLMYTAAHNVRCQYPTALRPTDKRTVDKAIQKAVEELVAELGLSNCTLEDAAKHVTADTLFPKLSGGFTNTDEEWASGVPIGMNRESDTDKIERTMICEQILQEAKATAEPYVYIGLASIYYDDTTFEKSAAKAGVDRGKLGRGIKSWAKQQQLFERFML